jgi:hypothetical protein
MARYQRISITEKCLDRDCTMCGIEKVRDQLAWLTEKEMECEFTRWENKRFTIGEQKSKKLLTSKSEQKSQEKVAPKGKQKVVSKDEQKAACDEQKSKKHVTGDSSSAGMI